MFKKLQIYNILMLSIVRLVNFPTDLMLKIQLQLKRIQMHYIYFLTESKL